jgi:hypothetical protein
VDEQIAHRHLACDERVRHLEPRHIVDDRRVPADLALVDEDPQGGGGEDLRVRRDAEERARVHRGRVSELSHAITPRHHHRAILDDREGETWNLKRRHGALHPRVQIRRGLAGCGGGEQ